MKRSFTAVIISVFLVLSTGCAGTDSSQPAQDSAAPAAESAAPEAAASAIDEEQAKAMIFYSLFYIRYGR